MAKADEMLECSKFLGEWCQTNPIPSYNFNN